MAYGYGAQSQALSGVLGQLWNIRQGIYMQQMHWHMLMRASAQQALTTLQRGVAPHLASLDPYSQKLYWDSLKQIGGTLGWDVESPNIAYLIQTKREQTARDEIKAIEARGANPNTTESQRNLDIAHRQEIARDPTLKNLRVQTVEDARASLGPYARTVADDSTNEFQLGKAVGKDAVKKYRDLRANNMDPYKAMDMAYGEAQLLDPKSFGSRVYPEQRNEQQALANLHNVQASLGGASPQFLQHKMFGYQQDLTNATTAIGLATDSLKLLQTAKTGPGVPLLTNPKVVDTNQTRTDGTPNPNYNKPVEGMVDQWLRSTDPKTKAAAQAIKNAAVTQGTDLFGTGAVDRLLNNWNGVLETNRLKQAEATNNIQRMREGSPTMFGNPNALPVQNPNAAAAPAAVVVDPNAAPPAQTPPPNINDIWEQGPPVTAPPQGSEAPQEQQQAQAAPAGYGGGYGGGMVGMDPYSMMMMMPSGGGGMGMGATAAMPQQGAAGAALPPPAVSPRVPIPAPSRMGATWEMPKPPVAPRAAAAPSGGRGIGKGPAVRITRLG
jgi:hypothetical protein